MRKAEIVVVKIVEKYTCPCFVVEPSLEFFRETQSVYLLSVGVSCSKRRVRRFSLEIDTNYIHFI